MVKKYSGDVSTTIIRISIKILICLWIRVSWGFVYFLEVKTPRFDSGVYDFYKFFQRMKKQVDALKPMEFIICLPSMLL